MFKRISFMIPILFFLLGTTVFAHSRLEDSNPKSEEVVTSFLKEIKLSFETNLKNTSTFSLQTGSHSAVPVSKVTVEGKQLVGDLQGKLPNGTYNIHWKEFGIDGHLSEGDIPFSVAMPATQTAAAAQEMAAPKKKGTEITASKSTASSSIHTIAAANSPDYKNYIFPISVCVFVVSIMACYWLIFRRKHI